MNFSAVPDLSGPDFRPDQLINVAANTADQWSKCGYTGANVSILIGNTHTTLIIIAVCREND